MSCVVAIYQPQYLPRLHYLNRAWQADVFVLLDDVEFSHQSPQHRTPLRRNGTEWLTVPIRHGRRSLLKEVRPDPTTDWARTHLRTLRAVYGGGADRFAAQYEAFRESTITPDEIRDDDDRIRRLAEPDVDVDALLSLDAQWQTQKRAVETLRRERNRLAETIASRRESDSDDALEPVLERARGVKRRLHHREQALDELTTARTAALERLTERLVEVAPEEYGHHERSRTRLVELTIPLLQELFDAFDVGGRVVRASELDVERPDDPSRYNARLVEAVGGDVYLSGKAGYRAYLDEQPFDRRDIDVQLQEWDPRWPEGNVCALDVLFEADDPAAHVR